MAVSLVGRMGPDALAEFLLLRRVAAWVVSALLLGMGVGVARFVAQSVNRPDIRDAYFIAALGGVAALTIPVVLAMNVAAPAFARVLLGNQRESQLISPLSIVLIAYVCHGVVFAYYRGRLLMTHANALQFVTFAMIPVMAVALLHGGQSIARIYVAIGLLSLVTNGVLAASILVRLPRFPVYETRAIGPSLLRYGIARLPADLGPGALLALGPVIAAHFVPISQVGYFLLGLSILNVFGTAANPLNMVLLSKVSMMLAQGRKAEARECAGYLLSAAVPIGLFGSLQLLIYADVFVKMWVGPRFLAGVPVIRILGSAMPFFLVYSSLRSLVDAASAKSHNAVNATIALAMFCVFVGLQVKTVSSKWLIEAFASSLLLALVLLAVLTTHSVRVLFQLRPNWADIRRSGLGAGLLGALSLFVRWTEGFSTNPSASLFTLAISSALFMAYLFYIRSPWLMFLNKTLFSAKKPKCQPSNAAFEVVGPLG